MHTCTSCGKTLPADYILWRIDGSQCERHESGLCSDCYNQASSRENGKLGGRPPMKSCPRCGDKMIAVDNHWTCTNANCTETHAISQSGAIIESLVEESIDQAETDEN